MKTKVFLTIVFTVLIGVCPVKADLVFDSGYNTFDDTDPYYDEVWVINDAHLDVLGGQMGKLEFRGYSTGNIYGGEMDWLFTFDNSVANIYGGTLDWLGAFPGSTVYLYAYDVTYHLTGGLENRPWAEGTYYSDNTSFSFTLYDEYSYSHVAVVPEPVTFLLFGLGMLLLRKRN